MNNTNNTHPLNDTNNIADLFSGDDADGSIELPPLPVIGQRGEDVCATIRLYLGIWNDLSPIQQNDVLQHMQVCPSCAREQQVLGCATQIVQHMPHSEPSARVDQAIFATLAKRRQAAAASTQRQTDAIPPIAMRSTVAAARRSSRRRGSTLRTVSLLAAVIVCVFAISLAIYSAIGPSQQAFALPSNLSWNKYVLLSKQTMMSDQGVPYQVISYNNMQEGMVNVETVMDGKLDVVAVGDQKEILGMDMMHHVAQWDAQNWMSDTSSFDLATLRQDLQDKKAVYAGKESFQGQEVYCIRYADGHMLLLNKDYMPVNVLEPDQSQSQGKPMYDTLQWLAPAKVSSSMWNMQVPQGFAMGKLPAHP